MLGQRRLSIVGRLRRAWSEVVDLLYPPRCEVCGVDSRQALCEECIAAIKRISEPFCRRCHVPFAEWEGDLVLCRDCRRSRSALLAARAAGLHTGTLRAAVLALKFNGALRLVEPLARLLLEVVFAEAEREDGIPVEQVDAIVPAVLHPKRRRWRGFDQALLISRALSAMWGVPVADVLVRQRFTVPQVTLRPSDRKLNLRGAFAVKTGADVEGLTVVVVDDVFTTGATLEACASALKRAGAARVYGLTVTRTAPPWHQASQDPEVAAGV